MEKTVFFNFHTHHPTPAEGEETGILNIRASQPLPHLPDNQPVSVGIHPWDVHLDTIETQWDYVQQTATEPQVWAIGEAGLDRLATASLEVQTDVFRRHIQLAEQVRKPLIIHCVRAFPELVALKKSFQPAMPWIVHGYTNNATIARQLAAHDFYFSFGTALLQADSQASTVLTQVAAERYFLETDDKNLSVREIYVCAAERFGISVEAVQEQVAARLQSVFRHS